MLSSKTTWLISLATAALFVSVGGDGSATSSTLNNDANGTSPTTNNNNGTTPNDTTLMNNSVGEVEDNTDQIPAPDVPGLGEEPGQELIPVGYLNGIWRIATNDINDVPVVYLTIVHDEGATTATCDYEMSIGAGDKFDGKVGRCISATWQNDQLIAKFNPTADSEEIWTLSTSTKADANTMAGAITKEKDTSYNLAVDIERQVPDPNDDGVRPAYNGQ